MVAALKLKYEAFIIYVATLSVDSDDKMHLLKRAQITYLKADEVPIKVFKGIC